MITVKKMKQIQQIHSQNKKVLQVGHVCRSFKMYTVQQTCSSFEQKKQDTKNVAIIICQVESTAVASVFV